MLTFAPDDATSLTLILNYQRDPEAAAYSGVPVYGSALPNPAGRFPIDLNVSEPAYEEFDRKQRSATLLFNRKLNDALNWTVTARYYDVDLRYRQIYGSFSPNANLDAAGNTDLTRITRGGGGADERFRTLTIDNRIAATFATGPVGHTLMAGADWQNNRGNNVQAFATGLNPANPLVNIPDLDVFAPRYAGQPGGAALPTSDLLRFPGVTRSLRKIDQVGAYLQDQVKIGGLNLIASGRWDWYEQLTVNKALPAGNRAAVTQLKQDAFTYRLGALYEFDVGLSPFASYSESFEPQAGLGYTGNLVGGTAETVAFVPVRGRQYEAGLKFQPRGANALFTLSAFDLKRRNVPVADPRGGTTVNGVAIPQGAQVQVGEVQVRGIELDGRGDVAPGLSVTVAGTYTDPRVTRGNPVSGNGAALAGVTGTRPLGVPKWSASSFVAWRTDQAAQGPLGGFELGAGVRYVGESDGTSQIVRNRVTFNERFKSPGFVLVDALIAYDVGKLDTRYEGMTLSVNAANLFDKRHIASCFFNNSCYFGAPRTVTGTLRYSF
jgi:iron complex outermembrane receptor protein